MDGEENESLGTFDGKYIIDNKKYRHILYLYNICMLFQSVWQITSQVTPGLNGSYDIMVRYEMVKLGTKTNATGAN